MYLNAPVLQFDDYKGIPGGEMGVLNLAQRVNIVDTLTLVVSTKACWVG